MSYIYTYVICICSTVCWPNKTTSLYKINQMVPEWTQCQDRPLQIYSVWISSFYDIGVEWRNASASQARGPRFESRREHSSFSLKSPDFVPVASMERELKGIYLFVITRVSIPSTGQAHHCLTSRWLAAVCIAI